jgi:class 3 adenylate cyclase
LLPFDTLGLLQARNSDASSVAWSEAVSREIELAILFADVSDSTQLYEALGDAPARAIVADCLDALIAITRRQGGLLARTIGDEVMTTFRTADSAAAASVEMQDTITSSFTIRPRSLAIRIGFHFGSVLADQEDVHGDAVNVASRVVNQAKPGQILTTGAALQRMGQRWRSATRQIALADLKGKRGQVEVHEVIWKASDMTLMQVAPWVRVPSGSAARLTVSFGALRVELGPTRPAVTVGRDGRNDLVIGESTVSRLHARIEHRKGRFVLIDQSANGTFVVPEDGASGFVHRDSVELSGHGLLGLGTPPSPGSGAAIRYEIGRSGG